MYVPRYLFFTKGVGVSQEKLSSFENALCDAGIAQYNLVSVSSIFPPGCEIVSVERGNELLSPGQIVHCVLARENTEESGRRIVSSIGLALPTDGKHYGYLSEHHGFGQTEEEAGFYSENLAACMLANSLGDKNFCSEEHYNEESKEYLIADKKVKTQNFTKDALGEEGKLWTTVISAAVFIP